MSPSPSILKSSRSDTRPRPQPSHNTSQHNAVQHSIVQRLHTFHSAGQKQHVAGRHHVLHVLHGHVSKEAELVADSVLRHAVLQSAALLAVPWTTHSTWYHISSHPLHIIPVQYSIASTVQYSTCYEEVHGLMLRVLQDLTGHLRSINHKFLWIIFHVLTNLSRIGQVSIANMLSYIYVHLGRNILRINAAKSQIYRFLSLPRKGSAVAS